ncbi:type VII secretion protein EccE [Gordonia araii NBRC 100433]|nr:type VII secretion protein EccE [Gordonia araii]NNG95654.1 type VII secretion protein EccE [Gordonia araii NBRC 100433]
MPALVIVELIVITCASLLVALTSLDWWAGLIIGLVIGLPLLVRRGGVSLVQRLWQRLVFAVRRRQVSPPIGTPFDVPMSRVNTCGMRWDGDRLITVLRIDPAPISVTRFVPGATFSSDVIPVEVVAGCLEQFDLELESIDIISRGSRAYGDGQIARIYDGILGPLPAAAFRTVWVVLRLDPLASTEAISRRGGGATGTLKAAMVATRRIANHLASQGHPATILTAAEITEATWQLTEGYDPNAIEEELNHAVVGPLRSESVSLDADSITTGGLMAVWAQRSLSTVLALHLRPADEGDTAVSAIARFTMRPSEPAVSLPGSQPLTGLQRTALRATLPVADTFHDRRQFEYFAEPGYLAGVDLPMSGCGQLIGADAQGRAVALPLAGPAVRHVDIVGPLRLAQQVILRAIALGARVLVNTERPAEWARMAQAVGNPHVLTVAGAAAGSQVAGQRQEYSVTVFDGVPLASRTAGGTYFTVSGADSQPGADITLRQNTGPNPLVTVAHGGTSTDVMMVATPDELRYLGAQVGTPVPVH